MKKLILALGLLMMGMGTSIYAQDIKREKAEQRKEQKAQAKAQQELEDAMAFHNAVGAMQDKKFVLEADQLVFKTGENTFVNSNTNFIALDSNKGTVQIAFNSGYPGPNGLGGITVDGNITDVKMKVSKKGSVSFKFNIQGVGVSAQVFLTLRGGNDYATATISPNFNSRNITMNGRIVPLEESDYFKGTAI